VGANHMWTYVAKQSNPHGLWHAMAHHTVKAFAHDFGRRQDSVQDLSFCTCFCMMSCLEL
jgi:IS1 family transposase